MGINKCDAILAGDIINKTTIVTTQKERYVASRLFYSLDENEAYDAYKQWVSKNSDNNLNVGVRFATPDFSVGVDVDNGRKRAYTEGEFKEAFRQWKQIKEEELSTDSTSFGASEFRSYIRDPNTVQGWTECVTARTNEPEILGYGFRDGEGNAFVIIDWNPGEFLAGDRALLNIETFGNTTIGGQYKPNFVLGVGSGISFPVITDKIGSFSVLANITVRRRGQDANFAEEITIPPIQVPEQDPTINVLVHLNGLGDLVFPENELAGTRDESRPLEGFQIDFVPPFPGLGLRYMAHIQAIADVDFVNQGTFIGTRGESRRLEGFAIELTGARANDFDVTYSAFLGTSTFGNAGGTGNTEVFSNGDFCGTRGEGRILAGLKIKIRKKRA